MHIISNDINPFRAIRFSKLLKAESQIEKQKLPEKQNQTKLLYLGYINVILCHIFIYLINKPIILCQG